jgi:hypothetical protein
VKVCPLVRQAELCSVIKDFAERKGTKFSLKKVKGAKWGAFSTLRPERSIVFLPLKSSLRHLQRRSAPSGARGEQILPTSRNELRMKSSFDMPQSWDMGEIISLPLRSKAC